MDYVRLIELLLVYFGPALRDLLDRLFRDVHIGTRPLNTGVAIGALFAEARRKLWWWYPGHWSAYRKLKACEKIALTNTSAFAMALAGLGAPPVLTTDEAAELAALL